MTATLTTRDQVKRLREDGLTYREIAARLGISLGYAKKCGSPGVSYENTLRASREAKRRRSGECVDCGRRTSYAGGRLAVSERCSACAARRNGDARLNHGPVMDAAVELLAGGQPVRFSEIREAITAADGSCQSINVLLYGVLIPRGYARRIGRGLYVAGPALAEKRAA